MLSLLKGEAVTKNRNGFRKGIVEIARLTAYVRLLDAGKEAEAATPQRNSLLRRLLRR